MPMGGTVNSATVHNTKISLRSRLAQEFQLEQNSSSKVSIDIKRHHWFFLIKQRQLLFALSFNDQRGSSWLSGSLGSVDPSANDRLGLRKLAFVIFFFVGCDGSILNVLGF